MMTGWFISWKRFLQSCIVLFVFLLPGLSGCITGGGTPPGPTPSNTSLPTATPTGLPDLLISDLRLEITPEELCTNPATPYNILIQVKNQGQTDAGPFALAMQEQPSQQIASLPAGESAEFRFTSNTLEIAVQVDLLSQVVEENEANNRIFTHLALPSPPPACASTPAPRSLFVGPLLTLEGHTARVLSVDFSPDGNLVASGSVDNTLRLWRVKPGNLLRTMRGHPFPVVSLKFSPNGALLATGSTDGILRIWRVSDARLLQEIGGHAGRITSLSFSGDGKYLVSCAEDFTVRVWRMSDYRLYQMIDEGMSSITSVAFSPDNQNIAWSETNGTVRIRTLAGAWKLVLAFDGISANSVAYHPSGDRLAVGFSDGSIRIIDSASGEIVQFLKSHTLALTRVVFSPDGRWLVSASLDGTTRLWAAAKNGYQESPALIFSGHIGAVRSISISPSGALLSSGADDNTVRLWQIPGE